MLDGNMYPGKMNIGGAGGKEGIQAPHYGIWIGNSGNITIKNVTTQRFGLDGVYIHNRDNTWYDKNIVIDSLLSDYNGRQGISITSGDSILITNSKFNNTHQGILQNPPGAGVDIEMEYEIPGQPNTAYQIHNLTF